MKISDRDHERHRPTTWAQGTSRENTAELVDTEGVVFLCRKKMRGGMYESMGQDMLSLKRGGDELGEWIG